LCVRLRLERTHIKKKRERERETFKMMDEEMEYLEGKVEEAYEKILPWKEGGPYPFWLYIREEYDKVRSKYDEVEKTFDHHKTNVKYRLESLNGIEEKLRRNKDSMAYLMPAWLIPLEPSKPGENYREDFNLYADHLYKMVQYLGCLLEKIPDSFSEYESTLDVIKNDIQRSVDSYRYDFAAADFWKESMELREMLHRYPSIVEDVTSRYTEEQQTPDNLSKMNKNM